MTSTTMVIGGLTDYSSLCEASKWLNDILWEAYAPIPIETFVKTISGEFFGVFCARFASASDRIKALSIVKRKLVELGGKQVWANTDLPTEISAPEQFLLGLKKQLVAWGFTRASVRANIDGPSKNLKAQGKVVLIVTCVDGCLVCDWAETWKLWEVLQKNRELETLTDDCNKKLTGGGKGKGKEGGKGNY